MTVLPDVAGLDKQFAYSVPPEMADEVRVGTVVRIPLHGRRVGGWVVAVDVDPPAGVQLRPIAKVTGWGPPPDLVALARWAAWRWAGRTSALLGAASPQMAVRGLPSIQQPAPPATVVVDAWVLESLAGGPAVLRLPPAADPFPVVAEAAARGPALIVVPSLADASFIAGRLRRHGTDVALLPREWAKARAGGCTVVGSRAGAWAPIPEPTSIVVLDAHDEGLQQEQAPTWHARDVAAERARGAGIPFVAVSPCPDLETLGVGRLVAPSRRDEREGWPIVDIVDRRADDPRTGLFSDRLVNLLRSGKRVVCVLNRKGRARLLACNACGELARCERCLAAVEQRDDLLSCRRCGTVRPKVCDSCGGQRLKALRLGVARVREELEALVGNPVGEVTAESDELPDTDVVVGTEAVLHRMARADAVAFLEMDAELLAPRFRAAEQALALLARAGRLVGGRAAGGRILVQTRLPDHEVLQAALHADPTRVSTVEAERRAALRFPPATAMAAVSGAAAGDLVEQLERQPVELLGPVDGRWLVRAGDHRALCDAFAATTRPQGRLRVEVDPLRV